MKYRILCRNCKKWFDYIREPGVNGPAPIYCSSNCRKRHWDKLNRWRYKDNCPGCGALKFAKSAHCKDCANSGRRGSYNI